MSERNFNVAFNTKAIHENVKTLLFLELLSINLESTVLNSRHEGREVVLKLEMFECKFQINSHPLCRELPHEFV